VTSLSEVLNKLVEIGSVLEPVIQSFGKVFEMKPVTMMVATPEPVVNEVLMPV
jgi:hypothetical protein